MKKQYSSPSMKVYYITTCKLLSGSDGSATTIQVPVRSGYGSADADARFLDFVDDGADY